MAPSILVPLRVPLPRRWAATSTARSRLTNGSRGWPACPPSTSPAGDLQYGHSTDLLGLLIARMEDAPLGDVLARRIFGPLGMQDTGFTVSQAKRARRARLYGFGAAGRLVERLTAPGNSTVPERPEGMAYVSGGQGLWSTVDDYLAFARMFIGGGAVDGVRLLRPETFKMMVTNQLTPGQRATAEVTGMPLFAGGHGFGLGVAVVMEPRQALSIVCGGGVGAVGGRAALAAGGRRTPTTARC